MVEKSPITTEEQILSGNANDIIEVINIDVGCSLEDEIHSFGQDSITVKWDGVPHQIKEGEIRLFPRYLANHIAKHLTNHVLTTQEKLTSDKERPNILSQILKKTIESYSVPPEVTQGKEVEAVVEQINTLTPPTPLVEEKPKTTSAYSESKPRPTRKELFSELDAIGIKYKGSEKVDELVALIEKSMGISNA
ncbi:hypothetical protein LCGC14_1836170 [marine sediment metagenome]|uniref:Uncharacterized protein n=1 Tax=marine sediment metagenome TaxID=412755 RepID=A0A0F9H2S8_9ZZZZ